MVSKYKKKAPPILENGGRKVASSIKSRVKGIAQKCKCGSVWCFQCFRQKHAAKHMERLRKFKWDHTREIVLTVDPSKFEDGEAAWKNIREHKLISNLIRNIERGKRIKTKKCKWIWLYKPIKILDWIYFLEWHHGGYPHYHLFLETVNKGKAGMIGGDRIRHYWNAGDWVYESFIKSKKHFKRLTGYFKGHGYFQLKGKHAKMKEHQVMLPNWAQEKYGSKRKIRRVCAKCLGEGEGNSAKEEEFFEGIIKTTDVIDIKTGEVLRISNKNEQTKRTYKAILKSCGQQTRVKIISDRTYTIVYTNIPYKKLRQKIPGEYEEGQGYAFRVDRKNIEWIMDNVLRVDEFKSSVNEQKVIMEAFDKLHEVRKEMGFWEHQKHYG